MRYAPFPHFSLFFKVAKHWLLARVTIEVKVRSGRQRFVDLPP